MISPNCAVIMDVTSTTSAYNSIERNARSEHLLSSNLSHSMDGSNENESLEELNHDPEDEDTLSDDSLRLRLSDDEADASQGRTADITTVPYLSSEQTTSQDTATGLADSDEKVTNKECQGSKHRSQILSETHVGGNKNINSMWRGGSRRQHSSNITIHSPKPSLRSHPFHVRYIHCHSNIPRIPSYFNNHDNFGRPPGYRKARNNRRDSRGKLPHSNIRNMQRNAVKEQMSNSKSELRSKTNTDTKVLESNQSPANLPNLNKQASSDATINVRDTTSPGTIELRSTNENSETAFVTAVDENKHSLPSVNDELSKECLHLNLNSESSLDKISGHSNPHHDNWKDHGKLSNSSYDSNFTLDNWFDEPFVTHDKSTRRSEISFPKLSQSSSDCQGLESSSPVQDTQSAIPSEKEKEPGTAIYEPLLLESSNLSSIDSAKNTIESDIDSKLNEPKVKNNDEIDVPSGIQTEGNTNGIGCKAIEEKESNGPLDSPVPSPKGHSDEVISSKLCSLVVPPEETEISKHQSNNVDDAKETIKKEEPEENSSNQNINNEKNADNEGNLDVEKTSVQQKVAEQPMEIVTEDKTTEDTGNDANNRKEESVLDSIEKKTSSDTKLIEIVECTPQDEKTLKDIEEQNGGNIDLLCNETSRNSSDNSQLNTAEKIATKPDSDKEIKSMLVMKRSLPDPESVTDKINCKKMKITPDSEPSICPKRVESSLTTSSSDEGKESMVVEKLPDTPKSLNYVRKFFHRDMKGKLSKLKREELEELIIQKLVETITMSTEIGRLREQARISERNQEATRVRCQQLSKQIKDFEMVLNRNTADRRSNNDKPVPPIKINRSVGLQVNFITEQGIQSLRALTSHNPAKTNAPSPVIVNGGNPKTASEKISHTTAVRRGLKVRSPRRVDVPKNAPLPIQSQTSNATPAALVISKPPDTSHNLSIPNNNKEHPSPNVNIAQPAAAAKVQNIVVNGKISHQLNRQTVLPNNQKPESNDLIDLTEEEDKNRSTSNSTPSILPMVGAVTPSIGAKLTHPRFPRVVQATIPGNVAIATQPANIRVVQSVGQPTPTALVNNINTTRLAYVMQGTPGAGRQLLIAPNPNQIRPVVSTTRAQYSNVTYKTGISTLANGSVRVITTAAPTIPNSQPPPAPLPDTPHYPPKNGWKLPPPPPSLKISKVSQGIVLSWNMAQSENYAEIASYQLYAYQEIPGTPPNSNLWKKVGDVRALPLPMACTLKEFTPGNNYHFAVRAVDTHSRLGQYSIPRNISL